MPKPLARPLEAEESDTGATSSSSRRRVEKSSLLLDLTLDEIANVVADEIVAEAPKMTCSNPNCGAIHLDGTIVCDRCNTILADADWDPEDPLLTENNFHYYLRGENAVIDDLLQRGDPSVVLTADSMMIIAQPSAVALASNPVRVQEAAEHIAEMRISEATRRTETYDRYALYWSHKHFKEVTLDVIRQNDFDNAFRKAKKWCRNNMSDRNYKWHERNHSCWLTLRLEGDTEYLHQAVLRDQISDEPWKKHWDVQRKAERVARKLGSLEAIHAWYAAFLANTARARAEDTCSAAGKPDNGGWFMLAFLLLLAFACGAILGGLVMKFLYKNRDDDNPRLAAGGVVAARRDVGVQSQTTYTELRGNLNPRFHPLPDNSHGVFF